MSEKYVFPITGVDDMEPVWINGYKIKKPVQAWNNFMSECDWKATIAITWLANEWNATWRDEAIIFETEQDKIMWMLRWS